MTQTIWRAAGSGHFCALYLMDVRTALLGIEIVLSIEEMIKEGQVEVAITVYYLTLNDAGFLVS